MSGIGATGGIVIEFLGMPGVGKTTLARCLAEGLCARGHHAALVAMDSPVELSRPAKLIRHLGEVAPYLLRHPRRAWRATRLLQLFPQPTQLGALSRLRYWWRTAALAERAAAAAPVAILDQGSLQGLFSWALSSTAPDPASLPAALRLVRRPQIVVIVSAPADTVRARLQERAFGHRRIDRLLLADGQAFAAARAILARLEPALATTDCQVLRIDSSPAGAEGSLVEQVAGLLAGGGRPRSAQARR